MKWKLLSFSALLITAATAAVMWGSNPQAKHERPVQLDAPVIPDSFETRAQKILKMPPGELKETSMSVLAEKWAAAAPEQALAFRPALLKSPKIRQAFDKTAMPYLCKVAPMAVLQDIRNGVWWQDQWRTEHDALDALAKGADPARAWQYVAETQDKQRPLKLSSWIATQKGKTGTCIEYLWKQNGEKSSKLLEAALIEWMKIRPEEAAAWLDTQTGALKTEGIAQMVQALLPDHPQDALAWSVVEQEENVRKQHTIRIAKAVKGKEAVISSLVAFLGTTALSQAEKSQLTAVLKVSP